MALDLPIVLLIALAAIVVAASVARRSGEHADRLAGRRPIAHAARRGPVGAVLDLVDQSVAAYGVRRRLGRSTATHAERRAEEAQAALVARAEEIRHHRIGATPVRPTQLVVSGSAGTRPAGTRPGERRRAPARPTSTLPFELVTAVFAFVIVVGVVVAIWPRGTAGGVLSATGTPASSVTRTLLTPSPVSGGGGSSAAP
jgi:hypothetical protein